MASVSTATFCKRKTCPTTELLLLYQGGALPPPLASTITAHLAACDFCDSELFLLTKCPPMNSPRYKPAPIPEALYRLAKTLLGGGAPRVTSRKLELICTGDQLTLTDA